MRQTSLLAYGELDARKLNNRQESVLSALRRIAPATNRMIAEELGWPINTVTPRCLELRGKGKVVEAYTDIDNGRKATFWKLRQDPKEWGDVD